MTPERWQRVKKILEETLGCDPSSRSAHLAAACAGDDGLRSDVESFLTHDDADEFLERPPAGRPPPIPDSALNTSAEIATGSVEAVRVIDLAPYTTLLVSTRSSRYELIVVAPLDLEVLVKGGRRFPQTTRARLHRQDSIRVGEELRLEMGPRKIVTTRIEAIEVVA